MSTARDLRNIFAAGRPLVEQWLDLAEQFAALRDVATEKGLDWSQIKALLKAQVQDERAGDDKRVGRIIERAEFASAYADMLGLGSKMNEFIISDDPPHDPATGEITEDQAAVTPPAVSPESAGHSAEQAPASNVVQLAPPTAPNDFPDIPEALRRC